MKQVTKERLLGLAIIACDIVLFGVLYLIY